jgi:hypothetical protein
LVLWVFLFGYKNFCCCCCTRSLSRSTGSLDHCCAFGSFFFFFFPLKVQLNILGHGWWI